MHTPGTHYDYNGLCMALNASPCTLCCGCVQQNCQPRSLRTCSSTPTLDAQDAVACCTQNANYKFVMRHTQLLHRRFDYRLRTSPAEDATTDCGRCLTSVLVISLASLKSEMSRSFHHQPDRQSRLSRFASSSTRIERSRRPSLWQSSQPAPSHPTTGSMRPRQAFAFPVSQLQGASTIIKAHFRQGVPRTGRMMRNASSYQRTLETITKT